MPVAIERLGAFSFRTSVLGRELRRKIGMETRECSTSISLCHSPEGKWFGDAQNVHTTLAL